MLNFIGGTKETEEESTCEENEGDTDGGAGILSGDNSSVPGEVTYQ
jgi:hypothetical protein